MVSTPIQKYPKSESLGTCDLASAMGLQKKPRVLGGIILLVMFLISISVGNTTSLGELVEVALAVLILSSILIWESGPTSPSRTFRKLCVCVDSVVALLSYHQTGLGICWGVMLGSTMWANFPVPVFLLTSGLMTLVVARGHKDTSSPNSEDKLNWKLRMAPAAAKKPLGVQQPARVNRTWARDTPESESSVEPLTVARVPLIGEGMNFEAEVKCLVYNISPTSEYDRIVHYLVRMVKQAVLPVVPEAKIYGSASASMWQFGCTDMKAEVDIVCTCDTATLQKRLRDFFMTAPLRPGGPMKSPLTLLPDVIQKTATRMLSERLHHLKFWRSAFRGPEPKVVLLAPKTLGIYTEDIRVHFSVNTPNPIRAASVYKASKQYEKDLIIVVTRWAHDRCMSNVAKGHLHPYAWSLLVIHFFRSSPTQDVNKPTAELFGAFVDFYLQWWQEKEPRLIFFTLSSEAKLKARTAMTSPLYVEDLYDTDVNVGESLTSIGLERVIAEFERAKDFILRGERLAELMEHWRPPNGEEMTSHKIAKMKKAGMLAAGEETSASTWSDQSRGSSSNLADSDCEN